MIFGTAQQPALPDVTSRVETQQGARALLQAAREALARNPRAPGVRHAQRLVEDAWQAVEADFAAWQSVVLSRKVEKQVLRTLGVVRGILGHEG